MSDHRTLASVSVQCFFPDETIGQFGERFVAATEGKPPELIALAVWRMCERAYRDGRAEERSRLPDL